MGRTDRGRPPRRGRSDASFQRRSGVRAPRPTLLIVCEGAETEPRYFRGWKASARLATVTIEVVGNAGQAERVVGAASALRQERATASERASRRGQAAAPAFDAVWCVFDREAQHEPETFRAAVQRAAREQIRLAVSNPCFEYWFLLHLSDTAAPFYHAQAVKQELRRHIEGYEERADLFARLQPLTGLALERARRYHQALSERTQDPFPNPSTTVYELVELLQGELTVG